MNKRPRMLYGMAIGMGLLFVTGCAKLSSQQGVDNTWRASETPVLTSGETTQQEILDAFGPPSQIIALNDGSAFYYLREYGQENALFLILYNTRDTTVNYDRAVFFFDAEGVLTDFSYSQEVAPRK